ncbi:MAG: hypothetical protein JNM27_16000 [Leptospirales bacterium]|nr:hypothetical protein [Leptospirales bacterium]
MSRFGYVYIFILSCVVACGPKKKFTTFEKPWVLGIVARQEVRLLREPILYPLASKDEEKNLLAYLGDYGKETAIAVGTVDTTDRNDVTTPFIQVKCPPSIACKDGIGYVEDRFIQEHRAVLIPTEGEPAFKATHAWVYGSHDLPAEISEEFILSHLDSLGEERGLRQARDIQAILHLLEKKAIPDPRLKSLIKRWPSMTGFAVAFEPQSEREPKVDAATSKPDSEIQPASSETEPLPQVKVPAGLASKVRERIETYQKAVVVGFPMRDITWPGLAKRFSEIVSTPYVAEQILAECLADGTFSASGTDYSFVSRSAQTGVSRAKWTLETRPLEGVFLTEELFDAKGEATGKNENIPVLAVTAATAEKGLTFVIQTESRLIKLTPDRLPKYLADGGPGRFIQDIPADYKEVLSSSESYAQRIIKIALKHGTGGYDAHSGRMRYQLPIENNQQFLRALEIFRNHPNVESETDYKGKLTGMEYGCGDGEPPEYQWYKPNLPELRLIVITRWNEQGQQRVSSEEAVCFQEKDAVEIVFDPSAVASAEPDVEMNWWLAEPSSTSICRLLNRSVR